MEKIVNVSTGEVKVGRKGEILKSTAIGSCVVIAAYDSEKNLGVMARKVKVSVSKVDKQICVIIEDDGVGFEPANIGSNTGFGIFSIRERLEQLDGYLEIESEPGHGSRFAMTAPLKVEKSTEGVEV